MCLLISVKEAGKRMISDTNNRKQLLQEPRQHQQFLQQHRPRQPQQQHLENQLQEEQCDEQLQNIRSMITIRKESPPEYNAVMRGHISRQESPPPSYERAILHM